MEHGRNQKKLQRSTFPRGKRLIANNLNLRGFDGSPEVPKEAATVFLEAFYHAVDQTSSRTLDRDLSRQEATRKIHEIREGVDRTEDRVQLIDEKVDGMDLKLDAAISDKILPDPIRAAIAEPSLNKLSEIMKKRQAKDALAYAKSHIEAIDSALTGDADPENRYAEVLRSHRQRLLFAAASAASWLGDIDAGRAFWWRAYGLGPIDPEWHKQAAISLLNIGLKDELQHLVARMDQESEVYRKIGEPCLAYLKKDWPKVDELLVDTQSADLLLQRVEARLQIIDTKDIEAVELTAKLLDQSDGDTVLPIVNLIRAQLTLDLTNRVIGEYTPLDYDRRPLINSLVDRIDVALETTENDSLFRAQALGCLGIAAELLRDNGLNERFESGVEMLSEEVRSSVFPLHDSSSTPNKIHLLQTEGHFDANRATILKAEFYQASMLPEDVESELYETLFTCVDQQQRKYALLFLVQHLQRTNRIAEAEKLIDATPLRPADKWLVRVGNLPADKTPLDMVDEVRDFPLDVDVIEHLAEFTLSTIKFTSPENAARDEADLTRAEEAVRWTTRLVKILPSRSSKLRYAWALYAARRYKDLLTISRDLDPLHAEQAAKLEAWALVGLGRRTDAIDRFVSACETYPESVYFSVHAARFLLIDNRPKEAAELLEPHITVDSQDPDILSLYAQSIHNQAPNSQEHASRAFDLFARAYDMHPDPNIARLAWETARAAGREAESRPFITAVAKDAIHVTANTADDIIEAVLTSEGRVIQFNKSSGALADLVRRDRKL